MHNDNVEKVLAVLRRQYQALENAQTYLRNIATNTRFSLKDEPEQLIKRLEALNIDIACSVYKDVIEEDKKLVDNIANHVNITNSFIEECKEAISRKSERVRGFPFIGKF